LFLFLLQEAEAEAEAAEAEAEAAAAAASIQRWLAALPISRDPEVVSQEPDSSDWWDDPYNGEDHYTFQQPLGRDETVPDSTSWWTRDEMDAELPMPMPMPIPMPIPMPMPIEISSDEEEGGEGDADGGGYDEDDEDVEDEENEHLLPMHELVAREERWQEREWRRFWGHDGFS
jgi:hypothetical protein